VGDPVPNRKKPPEGAPPGGFQVVAGGRFELPTFGL
jgi:hypothetical protein